MTIDELRNGIERELDGEKFRLVLEYGADCSDVEFLPVVILYYSPMGTYMQPAHLNLAVLDFDNIIISQCMLVRSLAIRNSNVLPQIGTEQGG